MEEIPVDRNMIKFPANSLRICVDDQEQREIRGRICGVALENTIPFQSMANLFIEIEKALDAIGAPQSYQKIRSFRGDTSGIQPGFCGNPRRFKKAEEIQRQEGMIKTVDVIISSRQHTSWQGIVKGIDGMALGDFHSDLELIKLIEEA